MAGLSSPFALYADGSGNLLETEQGSGTVNAYSSTGVKTVTFSGFTNPIGVTKDAAGNRFVSSGIQNGSGGIITKIASNGMQSTFASGLNVPSFLVLQPATAQGPPATLSLKDPTIELHDVNGDTVAQNNDWQQDSQSSQIPTDLKPGDAKESALYRALPPGAYTAIVSGTDDTSGIGLVEAYYLSTP